jgi:hypothetical protein
VEICAKVFGTESPAKNGGRVRSGPAAACSSRGKTGVLRACSACAGDYEDPDRTAWPLEESDEDQHQRAPETDAEAEEFPAEK